MKIVEVTWTDIVYKDSGWHHKNDVDDFILDTKKNTVKQLGYVYLHTDSLLILVDSYFLDDRDYGTIHKIPTGCIVEIKELS